MGSITVVGDLDNSEEETQVEEKHESTIRLRDYQQEAIDRALSDLKELDRVLLVLATGLGKSVIFASLVKDWPGKVLVLVHLKELLKNAYETVEEMTGEILGVEMASEHYDGERVCVAMVQSIHSKLHRFHPKEFGLIIVDEAHHAASDTYKKVFEYFSNAKVIGLTATDRRADERRLPFQKVSYRMGIREGIEGGWLVPIKGKTVEIESIDLRKVKTTGRGDFDDESLDLEMVKGASAIADVIYKDWFLHKGILFFPGRQSARLVCDMLNRREPDLACYIDGETDTFTRNKTVKELREGKYNYLCNVGIATEGFNWPEASVVGMCCPTRSHTAYTQRVGRGTRVLEVSLPSGLSMNGLRKERIAGSKKPWMTILDFTGCSAQMNLISHEGFLENAKQDTDCTGTIQGSTGDSKDSEEEAKEATEEITRIQKSLKGVASSYESKTSFDTDDFNPFETGSGAVENAPSLKETDLPFDSITPKQFAMLDKYGFGDWTISRAKAKKMIGFIIQRKFRIKETEKMILIKIRNAKE